MTNKVKNAGTGTTAVWGGEEGPFWERATQVPVVSSVSFGYSDMEHWRIGGTGAAPILVTISTTLGLSMGSSMAATTVKVSAGLPATFGRL